MLTDTLSRIRTVLGSAALVVAVAASPLTAAASPLGAPANPLVTAPANADSGYGGMVHYVGNKNWNKGKWTGPGKKSGSYCRNCGGYRSYGYYGPYYNNWWVGPAIGFGTGLFVGSILAQPRYYAPAPHGMSRDAYCHRKYRSYNSRTGTYTGYDGKQHYCRIP
jgi:BA14K-like protein